MSRIEWTHQTWNPIAGCSVVSPGCANCYAMRMASRLEAMGQEFYRGLTMSSKAGPVWTGKLALASEARLLAPLRRKAPTMYFVNSMSDLFHEDVPDDWIDKVFAVMALSPQHTFQVLTKRSKRMRDYFTELNDETPQATARRLAAVWPAGVMVPVDGIEIPLPNVWLGVSAEDQARADERIPDLLATPAAVRFISAEPLLGPIDLNSWPDRMFLRTVGRDGAADRGRLDWVIVGGESGPGARPMMREWARSVRDQCAGAGVPFFFKQWGAFYPDDDAVDGVRTSMRRLGKRAAGRYLDGVLHDAMPQRWSA